MTRNILITKKYCFAACEAEAALHLPAHNSVLSSFLQTLSSVKTERSQESSIYYWGFRKVDLIEEETQRKKLPLCSLREKCKIYIYCLN